jgi:hypothetical protein
MVIGRENDYDDMDIIEGVLSSFYCLHFIVVKVLFFKF